MTHPRFETALLAAGCFWCVEAAFDSLAGVHSVESGYVGGQIENPTYEQVCTGRTGHAEAVRVIFDPAILSYAELLDLFFAVHDPTQLDRQGNDIGPQYRSALFPLDAKQQAEAALALDRNQPEWDQPIVTRIEPAAPFWPAEDYHERYFERKGAENAYCQAVVAPKLAKFRRRFAERLKAATR